MGMLVINLYFLFFSSITCSAPKSCHKQEIMGRITGLASTIGWLACTIEQTFLTLYLNRLTLFLVLGDN